MCLACGVIRNTDTHAEYEILLLHSSNGYTNAPGCHVPLS